MLVTYSINKYGNIIKKQSLGFYNLQKLLTDFRLIAGYKFIK